MQQRTAVVATKMCHPKRWPFPAPTQSTTTRLGQTTEVFSVFCAHAQASSTIAALQSMHNEHTMPGAHNFCGWCHAAKAWIKITYLRSGNFHPRKSVKIEALTHTFGVQRPHALLPCTQTCVVFVALTTCIVLICVEIMCGHALPLWKPKSAGTGTHVFRLMPKPGLPVVENCGSFCDFFRTSARSIRTLGGAIDAQ